PIQAVVAVQIRTIVDMRRRIDGGLRRSSGRAVAGQIVPVLVTVKRVGAVLEVQVGDSAKGVEAAVVGPVKDRLGDAIGLARPATSRTWPHTNHAARTKRAPKPGCQAWLPPDRATPESFLLQVA